MRPRWLKHRARLAVGLLVLAAAASASAALIALRPEAGRSGAAAIKMSNVGRAVELPPRAARQLAIGDRYAGGNVVLLAQRGDRSFYRIDGTAEGTCFALGIRDAMGIVKCYQLGAFRHAVLDMSIVDISANGDATVVMLAGIAADEVSRIELVAPTGRVVARIPVVENVYYLQAPSQSAIAKLRGVGANGDVKDEQPFR
jgi:hypothetical protein